MIRLDRRSFFKVTALGAGGVLIGLQFEPEARAQGRGAPAAPPDPHVYIKVAHQWHRRHHGEKSGSRPGNQDHVAYADCQKSSMSIGSR